VPDVAVARLDALPQGRGRVVVAAGREVALFRVGDEVHALENVCLHNGDPLGEGEVDDGCAVCPWHGWRYELSTGRRLGSETLRLVTFPAWVHDGDVVVRVP
jgi:nitrite reductase/ring-hydroxylating ferredoxin subunit